jgi:hypothetical protein
MLIAYKTFAGLDQGSRPLGVLPEMPSEMETISEELASEYESRGFTIATPEQYASIASALAVPNAQSMLLASIKVGVLAPAVAFGASLVNDFIAENVMMGITQDGMTATVLERMDAVLTALQTGSLYDSISKVRAIPQADYDTKYITSERLLIFINKVELYLGLPLSGAL